MTPERYQRIGQLFDAALERAPEERAAFLKQAGEDDTELRLEVEKLLAHQVESNEFLSRPALDVAAALLAQNQTPSVIGRQLSHYQIRSRLGAGGMGEVYLARDTRLDRAVALKVLPASFASDPDRLRRFGIEAKVTGALNHPNILTVHDIGTASAELGGAPYIVTELLEGEELRAQLTNGAVPVRKAIDYAQQIAAGLAAAHEKGVVHRDLKPENLFVTKDGRVKILDFGLAKLKPLRNTPIGSEVETQKQITNPGTVMGTAAYMSPEQVRGEEVDHRSDLFSFGLILFEMLSGRRAFQRETMAETMTAILKDDLPELSETNAQISPQLEKIVRRCLEKQPERRFQTASDLGFALETLSTLSGPRLERSASSPALAERTVRSRLFGNVWLAWAVAVVFLVAATTALAILSFRQTPTEFPAFRLAIVPPGKIAPDTLALSPDGRRLAFVARDASGKMMLWVRPLDAVEAQPLPGTEQTSISSPPFWSPDGRSLAFFAGGKLKKIELDGGTPQTICNAVNGRGGTWNRDGVILFQPALDDTLHRVSAAGGATTPLPLMNPFDQISTYRWPQFLPDGRRFLCYHPGGQASGIYAGSLHSRELKLVLKTNSNAVYASTGHLVFWREGALLAQPFDAAKQELTGEPVPIAEQVSYSSGIFHAAFSIADNGVLAYLSGSFHNTQLAWFDRSGKQLGIAAPPGEYLRMALSRDEQRVAFERNDPQTGTSDIWLAQLARGVVSRLTFHPANEELPIWSPDGNRIAFTSDREGRSDIYQKLASGAGDDELLLKSNTKKLTTSWSADGRFIFYTEEDHPETKADLWFLPLDGDRKPEPYLRLPSNEYDAIISPNGRWVAYLSDETGMLRIHVQSFPASGGRWQISPGVGRYPQWRQDGKELYYLSGDGKLMAVEVKTDSTFEVGVSKALFDLRTEAGVGSRRPYAVASDGQRFLVNMPVEEASPTPITVVLNWAAEAKR